MDPVFGYSLVPLVGVLGLGDDDKEGQYPYKTDSICIEGIESSDRGKSVAAALRKELALRSQEPCPWMSQDMRPSKEKIPVQMKFMASTLTVPTNAKQSPLSPRNPESPLYPAGIFSAAWLLKYLYAFPAVSIVFWDLDVVSDSTVIDETAKFKERLVPYGIRLIVIVTGSDLDSRLSELRRATQLPARSGLFDLPSNATPEACAELASSVWAVAGTQAHEFYFTRTRDIRRKRNIRPAGDNVQSISADARYTIKLACFAEFCEDVQSALKLWESAYDSVLLVLDSNEGQPLVEQTMNDCRILLDAISMKICRAALELGSQDLAARKFGIHILGVQRLTGTGSQWKAAQYMRFAELLSVWPDARPGSTGIAYLDAAKLLSRPNTSPNREDHKDVWMPYKYTPEEAFLAAVAALSGMPNAKAYAFAEYAQWNQGRGEIEAAEQADRYAWRLLQGGWPSLEKELVETLSRLGVQSDDKDLAPARWRLGLSDKLSGAPDHPLFEVFGTFSSSAVFIGRKVQLQLTLRPLFEGKICLSTLKLRLSVAQLELSHDASLPLDELTRFNGLANLAFTGGKPRTFELECAVNEPGDVEIVEVEITGSDKNWSQQLPVEPSVQWIASAPLSPKNIRHLRLYEPRRVLIEPRPAKLKMGVKIPKSAARSEKVPWAWELTNEEPEAVDVEAVVEMSGSVVHSSTVHLESLQSTNIEGLITLHASKNVVEVLFRGSYTASQDTVPVKTSHAATVEVLRPFRVTFDLLPEFAAGDWGTPFDPQVPVVQRIERRWRLVGSVLALSEESGLIIESTTLEVKSEAATIEVIPLEDQKAVTLEHNDHMKVTHTFLCRPNEHDSIPRSVDALAHLTLRWARKSSPDLINMLTVAPVRLSLPTQEPRVLAVVADQPEETNSAVRVLYWVENGSSHVLSFAISMASSQYFAFQGIKATSLRLLPHSRRCFAYTLIPVGEASLRNNIRPIPEFRAWDTTYKRALAVLSGDARVMLEQGSLAVKIKTC